jgi:thymidylate kinase
MEWRIGACDTVIFLDFPTEICLEGIKKRMGKARTDMPWIETEEDREFLTFVENFSRDTRPQILDILNRHPEKRIIIFKDRSYADDFLEQIKNQG